ncbi:MAG: insulinase family protein [Deferribacteres bacterium]|nr:insulinase family protein [candidate division KSB1 bacterium]MCB9501344.1 insulinase family protein [Deferribacteres bacterium]
MKTDANTIQKSVLPNGIRIVTERMAHVNSVAIGIWLEVGTRNEVKEQNGISHFIEHMLFKGTEKRTAFQIAECIENVGGHFNAFTSKDLTCYYIHVLHNHIHLALDVLSDILQFSLFNDIEIEKEKEIILEEIKATLDVPEERIHDYFFQDLFPTHPLGMPTLGTVDSLQSIDRKMLLQYMKKNYTGDRIVITAAGNIWHEEICEIVQTQFTTILSKPTMCAHTPPPSTQVKREYVENSSQAHICLGTQTFGYANAKRYQLQLLNTLLGGIMSSRLFQIVRETHGLCYNIYSYNEFFIDSGIFCIYTGTDKSNVTKSLELIIKELDNLKEKSILENELERTKSHLKGSLLISLDSVSNRMNRLAKMEIYSKKHIHLDNITYQIDQVTAEELRDLANILFDSNNMVLSVLIPKN